MTARLLVAVAGLAAVLTQDIQLGARFTPGDDFRLEIVQSVSDTSRADANFSTTTPVRVNVLSAGANGFVLEWRPGDTVRQGAPGGPEMKMALATMLTNNLTFRFALDSDGHFRSLVNSDELEPKLIAARDALLAKASAALRPDPETLDDLRSSLTPARIADVPTYDVKIYTDGGRSLPVGMTIETTVARMSPFTHKTVPAANVVRLDSATPELAVITRTTTLHSDVVNVMTPPATLREEAQFRFDRLLGLVRELTLDTIATARTDRRVDRLVIRMVAPPKR